MIWLVGGEISFGMIVGWNKFGTTSEQISFDWLVRGWQFGTNHSSLLFFFSVEFLHVLHVYEYTLMIRVNKRIIYIVKSYIYIVKSYIYILK